MFYKDKGVKIKTDFVHEPHLNHINELASCAIYPFVQDRIFLSHPSIRWADGTNGSSTKRLMFQILFFFIKRYQWMFSKQHISPLPYGACRRRKKQ